MRIVIDLQGSQTESRYRGIGRYSLSIAQAIARNASNNHDVWIVLNARIPENIPNLKLALADLVPDDHIRIFDVPCDDTPNQWMVRASELVRESFLDSLQPDIVLITSLFEGPWANAVTSIGAIDTRHKTAVILYDLIPLLNKNLYLASEELQAYYHQKIDWLNNADCILAISESSRQECIKHIGTAPEKIANISAAIEPQFQPSTLNSTITQEFFAKHEIKNKPILYVPGGFDSRKNFSQLIEAYSLLQHNLRKKYQLVIASKMSSLQQMELIELATQFGVNKEELILTGYVKDHELILLYSQAALFVFPSIHEGFGLPVLEAMACGAPVIGSNCSSIPEVIGLSEALFDPSSVQSIADKITQALTDNKFKDQLKTHALYQSQKFSWDTSAKLALATMESINSLKEKTNTPIVTTDTLSKAIAAIPGKKPKEMDLCHVASSMSFNAGTDGFNQLLLDISTIVHSDAKSGIQRVVRSLIHELLSLPLENIKTCLIYYDDGIYRYANHFTSHIIGNHTVEDDSPIDFYQDDIYLSLDLNMHLSTQTHPLHEHMRTVGVKFNFIVYDLLLVHRPDWWLAPNPDLFRVWLNNICLVGDNIICISQSVAKELEHWLERHSPKRIDNGPTVCSFHLGADINNSMPTTGLPDDAVKTLQTLSEHTSFLMVGTLEPRKGHVQTLSAFEQLWADSLDVNLVIVGNQGWMLEELISKIRHHQELGKRLFWLEGISDEYLEKIYAECTCLIAASEGEGFGLPLIEAAQHKLPIIARDIPVFREVAGEYAFYFDGSTPSALASAIQDWLKLYQSNQYPKSDSMSWLTWRESTNRLLQSIFTRKNI